MQQYENRQAVSIPPLLPISTNILPDHVRFVCISDTHNKMDEILDKIPLGDVLIHAGDFTYNGDLSDVKKFNEQLGKLPHKYKIVIAGNHELTFGPRHDGSRVSGSIDSDLAKAKVKRASDLLTNCTYLEDEAVSVYGINIYGSPWQPAYGGWAFNLKRGYNLMEKWARIPDNTDVLITHGPPVGHGDMSSNEQRGGCVDLLNVIEERVKPKFHVFGHIHEGYGLTTNNLGTVFINASTCNEGYRAVNDPIIFDLPLPRGVSKE
jgi:Icc-related predicted phosphoesterase